MCIILFMTVMLMEGRYYVIVMMMADILYLVANLTSLVRHQGQSKIAAHPMAVVEKPVVLAAAAVLQYPPEWVGRRDKTLAAGTDGVGNNPFEVHQ